MKKLFSEFRTFMSKGNVVGLAVGIIMGNAFNEIVNSLINDVIMPIIGLLLSGVSFDSWYIPLNGQTYDSFAQAKAAGAPMITIGNFISALVNFLIVAFVLFLIIKGMNKAEEMADKAMKAMKLEEEAKAAAEPPAVSDEVKLLTEIRDMMKQA